MDYSNLIQKISDYDNYLNIFDNDHIKFVILNYSELSTIDFSTNIESDISFYENNFEKYLKSITIIEKIKESIEIEEQINSKYESFINTYKKFKDSKETNSFVDNIHENTLEYKRKIDILQNCFYIKGLKYEY